jgi:hypothetical protein
MLRFRYAAASFVFFLGTFTYAVGFIGNVVVPKSVAGESQVCVWNGTLVGLPVPPGTRCEDEEIVKIPRCEL